jgi:ankyrin repeat protein
MEKTKEIIDAVKNGDSNKIERLLNDEPDLIHATTERGESIILLAVYYNQNEVAKLLLSKVADLTIFEAAAVGKKDQVEIALRRNADHLHAFSSDGWTALHLAAFFGHDKIVDYLVKAGAHINIAAKNEMAVVPLHSALANRKMKTAEKLLAFGADANAAQSTGWTPLHYAAAIGQVKIIEKLLKAGADKTAKNNASQTPAAIAKEKGHEMVVDLLRE